MTSREQFEAWYRIKWGCTEDDQERIFELESSDYRRLGVRMTYDSWRASRETIEIALPNIQHYYAGMAEGSIPIYDAINYATHVVQVILNTGITIK
ncbi:hypothetical protein ACLMPP_12430 [Yersinia enterocolitica]|uniref:hypothetical protein n=1 Tax=Yersinia enterocolitica TaxID=630 RepID=UPI00398D6785